MLSSGLPKGRSDHRLVCPLGGNIKLDLTKHKTMTEEKLNKILARLYRDNGEKVDLYDFWSVSNFIKETDITSTHEFICDKKEVQ